MNSFEKGLGDAHTFVGEIPALAIKFREIVKNDFPELKDLRTEVEKREDITQDETFFRPVLGAFAAILIDWYGQRVVVRGWFKKRVMVESKGFRCEFLDLFYRCVFEGLDLAPEGEGLPTKV